MIHLYLLKPLFYTFFPILRYPSSFSYVAHSHKHGIPLLFYALCFYHRSNTITQPRILITYSSERATNIIDMILYFISLSLFFICLFPSLLLLFIPILFWHVSSTTHMLLCLSFLSRHCCCLCIMGFGLVFLIVFSLIFATLPSFSSANLRSWLCGTCTICQLCPPCEPHLNVSPKCECHENLNNCNCNCISHKNLRAYHHEWNSQLLATQHNSHAAQMNSNQFKRWLLFSLIGLSCFNLLILIVIILLIIFSPALLRRCAALKSRSKLQRRQRLMRKHNFVDPSPPSTIALQPPPLLPIVTTHPTVTNSLAIQFKPDLHAAQDLRPTNAPK